MNIENYRNYCLSKKGVTETFPFNQDTLVFKVMGKMFALFPLEKWEQGKASMNLKCDPDYALELRTQYDSVVEGWHMSKKHWNTVYLSNRELPHKLAIELIDHSYDLVVSGLTKKVKAELDLL